MRTLQRQEETAMKIHVNRIPDEGLKEHASYDPSTMDMDRDDEIGRAHV